jgi:hypothetical protein
VHVFSLSVSKDVNAHSQREAKCERKRLSSETELDRSPSMSAKRQANWGNESVGIVAESQRPEYRVRMSFDGGCRSNPTGHAAGAAVITDLEGRLLRHVGHWIDVGSNNVAEWTGLLVGLRAAFDLGATHVEVFGDSGFRESRSPPFARRKHVVKYVPRLQRESHAAKWTLVGRFRAQHAPQRAAD